MLEIKKTNRKKNLNKKQIDSMWNLINRFLPRNMTKEEFERIVERTNENPNAELPQEINIARNQIIEAINKYRTTVKVKKQDIDSCFEDADEEEIIEKNKENIDKIMSEIKNEKQTKKTNKSQKQKMIEKYGRDPYVKSIFTDVLTNYCCLSKNAQKGFKDEVIDMVKKNNPNITEEEINTSDFAMMVGKLSDEQLAALNEAIIRVSKKDQSKSKLEQILNEQPEVDIEKKLVSEESTKGKKETTLTEADKKELWGMVKVGGLTIIIIAAVFGIKRCSLYKEAYENSLKTKDKKGTESTDPTQTPTETPTQEPTIDPTKELTITPTYENPVGDIDVEKIYEADGIIFASYEDYLEYIEAKNCEDENAPIMYAPTPTVFDRNVGVVNPDGTYTVTEVGTNKSRTYESMEAFVSFNNDTDCWLLGGNGIYYRMENQKVKSK